jgi:2-keto-3-deoxy-6-phosphogluconate aldolase
MYTSSKRKYRYLIGTGTVLTLEDLLHVQAVEQHCRGSPSLLWAESEK